MTEPIRILMAEDMLTDAELAQWEITQTLPNCTFLRVDTSLDYIAALKTFQPDIIISDFRMPQFNGLTALKLALEYAPLTPVIILTGSMNEDTAVECMKAGATDYVIKEHSKRLGPTVLRALEEKKLHQERQQAELTLHEMAQNMALAQKIAHFGSWEVNLISPHKYIEPHLWSDECYRIFGVEPGQVKPTTEFFLSRIHPDDRDLLWQVSLKAIQEEAGYSHMYRLVLPNNVIRYVHEQATIILDEYTGKPVKLVGMIHDITERKQAEEALQQSEIRFRALIEHAPDGIAMLRLDGQEGKFHYVSPGTLRILGYTRDEAIDYDPRKLTHPADLPALLTILTEIIQQPGQVITTQYRVRHKDGSWCWLESTISNLLAEPSVASIVFNFRDITERKQIEAELEAERALLAQRVAERTAELSHTNTALLHAVQAKDQFLATMSHELRTPLNAILGLSESLLEQIHGPLNEGQLKSITTIEKSGHHLLALINDILDLSKVEAGKLELQLEPVSVSEICQASLLLVKEMAHQKHIRLSFLLENLRLKLQADPRRLKQILVNLLSNAVKFTPQDGQVSLSVVPDQAERVIRFTVQDNGVGIKAEDIPRLFKPFTQLDSSLSRSYEGTGLGLALVRQLVELHGGRVWVESAGELGQGSCFIFTLPNSMSPEVSTKIQLSTGTTTGTIKSSTPPAPALPPTDISILLVEDNITNIQTIADYLEHIGYNLMVARTGAEALQLADEIIPDLILMDIQLPTMDGLQATRHLRTRPQFANIPIIALTALAMPGDRERCLAAGANDYVTKPVSLKTLAEMIKTLLAESKK